MKHRREGEIIITGTNLTCKKHGMQLLHSLVAERVINRRG